MTNMIISFCIILLSWEVHGFSDINHQYRQPEVITYREIPNKLTRALDKALNDLDSIKIEGEATFKIRNDGFLEENHLRLQEANNRLKETMEKSTDQDLNRCQNVVDDLYSKIIMAADKIFERLREEFDDCLSNIDSFSEFLTNYKSKVADKQLYKEDLLYWYVTRDLADFFKKIRYICGFQRKRMTDYGNYNEKLFDDYVNITKSCFNNKLKKI